MENPIKQNTTFWSLWTYFMINVLRIGKDTDNFPDQT